MSCPRVGGIVDKVFYWRWSRSPGIMAPLLSRWFITTTIWKLHLLQVGHWTQLLVMVIKFLYSSLVLSSSFPFPATWTSLNWLGRSTTSQLQWWNHNHVWAWSTWGGPSLLLLEETLDCIVWGDTFQTFIWDVSSMTPLKTRGGHIEDLPTSYTSSATIISSPQGAV